MRPFSYVAIVVASLAALPLATPARAADYETTADTTAQFYDVRSPTGETILARRRLLTTLGVGVYDLVDRPTDKPLGPELSFRARLRYDADYGANGGEVNATDYDRLVPGFSRGPVDLMYGYVEGRRFLNGWLGFRAGRQYTVDSLGWWSFDGGLVRVTTPYFVAVEAYGGLEVRGGMPLSTPRFERDGVWRGDRTGYDASLYPSFQPSTIAPAFGASVESAGVTWLHGKLTYRRVYNTGGSSASQYASGLTSPVNYDGSRISQERIGYALDANLSKYGGAKAGVVYDLYIARVTSVYANVDGYVTPKLTLSLDYDYYQPSFDADSIWNFFAAEPMNYFGLRANYDVSDKLSFAGSGYGRLFNVATEPTADNKNTRTVGPGIYPSNGTPFDAGGNLSARFRTSQGLVGLRGTGNFGEGGDRAGADVFGERLFEQRFVASGRASLWQWNDKLRPDRDATSVGYVAGLGYRFSTRSQALVEWEHNINRIAGQRFRVMLWLTLAAVK